MVVIWPEDWPLQACQPSKGGRVFINKRGTYGYSSAGYWWGRLAAATKRLIHYLQGEALAIWLLLFADDFDGQATGAEYIRKLLSIAWILTALGIPLSWAKAKWGVLLHLDRLRAGLQRLGARYFSQQSRLGRSMDNGCS